MPRMKPEDAAEFLKAKESLFAVLTQQPPERASFVTLLLEEFSKPEHIAKFRPIDVITSLERELDMMMVAALPQAAREEIARVLKSKFGFSHLSQNPDLVIRQILRRRKTPIRTTAEAELVVNVLASMDDDSVTADQRRKLGLLLTDYETSRR
jgi:hypothetical protein